MKYRTLSDSILRKSISDFGRILVVTGARQTGKTTLCKHLFPGFEYISIEDPVVVESYKGLTAAQWNALYPKAILDEIQKVPQLVESIKSVYDQYPDPRYLILGSSQILLMKKIRESLAGRCQIIELYPLTLTELMTNSLNEVSAPSYFQNIILNNQVETIPFLLDPQHPMKKTIFDDYLQFGGYPAISDRNIPANEKQEWLKNYVRTYLERDIRDLAELRHLEPFTKVQKLMALSTGQLVNFSRIAAEAGVSSKTVLRFLEYMNISYQTMALSPWNRNTKKRLIKSPKIHFLDIGVLRAILQKKESLNGHEYESAIVSEIFKQAKTVGADGFFYHLRTFDGRELDLLIETEKGYIAIEIKMSETVRRTDVRHFRGLDDVLDKPLLNRFILSNDLNTRQIEDGILAIPAVQFLT